MKVSRHRIDQIAQVIVDILNAFSIGVMLMWLLAAVGLPWGYWRCLVVAAMSLGIGRLSLAFLRVGFGK